MHTTALLSPSVLMSTIVCTLAIYRNCYKKQSICLLTEDTNPSSNSEFYLSVYSVKYWCESKNSSLAIIQDKDVQDAIKEFIDDSKARLNNDIVTDGRRSKTQKWQWINGRESGVRNEKHGYYGYLYRPYRGDVILSEGIPSRRMMSICSYKAHESSCHNDTLFYGRCYRVYSFRETWFEARSRCINENADLAIFDLNFHISQSSAIGLQKDKEYWVGFLNEMWLWSNDKKINFFNWEENYPLTSGGDCLCLDSASGKWKNCDCYRNHRFICIQDNRNFTDSTSTSTMTVMTQIPTDITTVFKIQRDSDDSGDVGSQSNSSDIFQFVGFGIVALLLVVAIIVLIVLFVKKKNKREVRSIPTETSHRVDERPASKTHEHEHVYQIENPNEAYAEIGSNPGTVYAEVVSSGRTMSIADKTPTNMVYAELDIAPMKGDNDTTKVQYEPQSSQSPDTVYANYNPTK